jgi:chromate transporter
MRFADFLITEGRAGGRSWSHVFTGFRSARPVSARAGRCDASAWPFMARTFQDRPTLLSPTGSLTSASGAAAFGLWPLFLFFPKVGAVLFGSGYVLLAFLRADLVERWHWLTEAQLLDAVAIGQSRRGRSSRRQPSSATCWPGRRAECSQRLTSFCPHSFSWQSAVRSCRGCDARRSSARFLTEW